MREVLNHRSSDSSSLPKLRLIENPNHRTAEPRLHGGTPGIYASRIAQKRKVTPRGLISEHPLLAGAESGRGASNVPENGRR